MAMFAVDLKIEADVKVRDFWLLRRRTWRSAQLLVIAV
jgi:hypothetical protein